MRGRIDFGAVLMRSFILGGVCVLLSLPAAAQETNFSRDVFQAVNDGIAYLDAEGCFNNPPTPAAAQEPAGLVALTLLERRTSADQSAHIAGYAGASPADQARLDRIMAFIIGRAGECGGNCNYVSGGDLMALAVYLRTGGPRQGDARNALNTVFDRIAASQNEFGYWCYTGVGCSDSSVTQLAMAGIASARAVYADAGNGDAGRLATLNQVAARTEMMMMTGRPTRLMRSLSTPMKTSTLMVTGWEMSKILTMTMMVSPTSPMSSRTIPMSPQTATATVLATTQMRSRTTGRRASTAMAMALAIMRTPTTMVMVWSTT
jgi:hypothetical protein